MQIIFNNTSANMKHEKKKKKKKKKKKSTDIRQNKPWETSHCHFFDFMWIRLPSARRRG